MTQPISLYEYTDGSRIHPDLRGQKVPVPPQDIRGRLRLPAKYALATLAKEVADLYEPALYNIVKSYLVNWPNNNARGRGPVLVGGAHTGTSYAAAALANEIVIRSQTAKDMDVSWLSCFWVLRLIQDAREMKRFEQYTSMREQAFKNELIVVDDLLSAKDVEGGVGFIHSVYAYRYDHNLPTITTITTQDNGYWSQVSKVFGFSFVERLKRTSEGLVGRVG